MSWDPERKDEFHSELTTYNIGMRAQERLERRAFRIAEKIVEREHKARPNDVGRPSIEQLRKVEGSGSFGVLMSGVKFLHDSGFTVRIDFPSDLFFTTYDTLDQAIETFLVNTGRL